MTVEQLSGLQVDDVIDVQPLLAGVTDEPVQIRIREIGDKKASGVALWGDVTLGAVVLTVVENEVQWGFK